MCREAQNVWSRPAVKHTILIYSINYACFTSQFIKMFFPASAKPSYICNVLYDLAMQEHACSEKTQM